MPRRLIDVNGADLLLAFDDEPGLGQRVWGIVRARLVDEISGRAPAGPMSISAEGAGLTPKATGDGLVGLVGVPVRRFSMLATQAYDLNITLRASGYLPVHRLVSLGPQPGFPATFAPLDLGDVLLRREPVVLSGRVVLLAPGGATPVPGATVRVTGYWPTPPPPTMATPADPPDLVAVQPPLTFARSLATGTVRRRNMTPSVGVDKQLLDAAPPGATTLRLSDSVALNAGDTLWVDAAAADRQETIGVQGVTPSGAATDAATITLAHPLSLAHREGALVRIVTPQAPGAANPLSRDAQDGDSCVFLTALADLAAAQVVEVSGGPSPPEFRVVSRYEVVSDADGYYRLPPISRVAQLELEASDGVNTPVPRIISPTYGVVENRVDLALQ